ncbi:MAG: uncharacterized protein JWN48_3211 [Myxococcaceae bacterium]|nr:uncharacterized protein [Myxococcaceae bacterium]
MARSRSIPTLCCFLGMLLLPSLAAAEARTHLTSSSRRADHASEIEQRLWAPCCWTQTLDVHDSELSSALRLEIRDRLSRGESDLSIQDALARRFGERIFAVPRAGDARGLAPLTVGVLMLLSLTALVWLVQGGRARRLALPELLERCDASGTDYELALERELERREETPSSPRRRTRL